MSTGSNLEALVRCSADRLEDQGFHLIQTSPRFVGSVGPKGEAFGRIVGQGALDFIGDFRGLFVTFDAKSTESKTAFKLDLIKRHQAVIVRKSFERGAIAFFLVEFSKLEPARYFALTWPVLKPWWGRMDYGGPQSIPFAFLEAECLEIHRERKTLDLVGTVEALMQKAA